MKNDYFSSNLQFIRRERKMTQAQIADFVGVKRNSWNNYENGKSVPNLELFKLIAKLFDISTQDLLYTDLQKGEVIKKPNIEKNQKKGEVKGEVSGELIASEPETYNKSPGQITLIQALQNSLHDKDELLSAQKVIISHLNARIAALERELIEAQKIYAKLKLPAGK